ncbi:MAG: hypothetical protein ABIA66_00915, partial [Candidatus Omnitrophota bacterium]
MKKILRVFVRRTSYTPVEEEYVVIGGPGLFTPVVDEIHVSIVFTWDRTNALILAQEYGMHCPQATIKLGGPGWGTKPKEFIAGVYVKRGITITSRGCNFNCPWCLVPRLEGKFRELKGLEPGNNVQDNNILFSSKQRLRKVFKMLRTQKAIRFSGGLDKRLLKSWHIEELRSLRIAEIWLAFDSWDNGSILAGV